VRVPAGRRGGGVRATRAPREEEEHTYLTPDGVGEFDRAAPDVCDVPSVVGGRLSALPVAVQHRLSYAGRIQNDPARVGTRPKELNSAFMVCAALTPNRWTSEVRVWDIAGVSKMHTVRLSQCFRLRRLLRAVRMLLARVCQQRRWLLEDLSWLDCGDAARPEVDYGRTKFRC
jgi:hypothetical protein